MIDLPSVGNRLAVKTLIGFDAEAPRQPAAMVGTPSAKTAAKGVPAPQK